MNLRFVWMLGCLGLSGCMPTVGSVDARAWRAMFDGWMGEQPVNADHY